MSERASTKGRDDELASASIRPELIERVESGEGADKDLHRVVLEAFGVCAHRRTHKEECDNDGYDLVCSDCGSSDLWLGMNPTGSLDAVVSLIERKLPEANCHGYDLMPKEVVGYVSRNCIPAGERAWMHEGYAKTPARALLAACLRALQTKLKEHADANSKNPLSEGRERS